MDCSEKEDVGDITDTVTGKTVGKLEKDHYNSLSHSGLLMLTANIISQHFKPFRVT